jgi:hypothetical protein
VGFSASRVDRSAFALDPSVYSLDRKACPLDPKGFWTLIALEIVDSNAKIDVPTLSRLDGSAFQVDRNAGRVHSAA